MTWALGVDVGGTFTDFFAYEAATGASAVLKLPSTPDDPARAIAEGLKRLAAAGGIPAEAIDRFAHGTTVATNALIQRRGGRVALVTTEGFRDLVEIGRQTRPRIYDLQADNPPPLAPRERRFEVAERVGGKGQVVTALDDDAIADIVEQVRAAEVEGCAVCLLFSFLNPDHERRIGAAIEAALPDVLVSLSSDVQPEFREYERFSATLLNAFLQPRLTRYLTGLGETLKTAAPRAAIGINQSSGGLMSIARAAQVPIRTALSGPAAGAVGAAYAGHLSDRPDLITFDMGGTSTDVCLIADGAPTMAFEREVAGFPIRQTSVDINTVGAGGGSIAWVAPDGLLKVGPTSAGAEPGPACYGRGGDQPTVSDANLVLGRLSPVLIGGEMRLDRAAAAAALAPVMAALDLSLEQAALGIIAVVNSNMVRAIRAVSIERGHDPRDFVLIAFGGAGALHSADVAAELGISEVVVPSAPGILCAQGLVVSDLRENFVATCRTRLPGDPAMLQAVLDGLSERAAAWHETERIDTSARDLMLTVDMRYVGQNYELGVNIREDGALGANARPTLPDAAALTRLFHAEHDRAYGHHDQSAPIEIVNLRLTAVGRLPDPGAPKTVGAGAAENRDRRPVWFESGPEEADVVDRLTLEPGQRLAGPTVITQLDSTILVPPDWYHRTDPAGNLILEHTP